MQMESHYSNASSSESLVKEAPLRLIHGGARGFNKRPRGHVIIPADVTHSPPPENKVQLTSLLHSLARVALRSFNEFMAAIALDLANKRRVRERGTSTKTGPEKITHPQTITISS